MEAGQFIGILVMVGLVFTAGYFAGHENSKNASWLEARKYEIDKQAEIALEIAKESLKKNEK